ncbi:transcriptional regulator [Tolypothrix sp. NIES-4075]|uniref:AraC family transcriptional regulator n=1 Tax=Tolypothrix sp. NIES-4075 TaxID=2005459 RepID=UPI000B5C593A|nr:AraC family transcriptional regulator [Tolypothrix sp. NIES-4075]GAX41686.1 transcriptional regulator [Tolypothrix sp. NIES-4075]
MAQAKPLAVDYSQENGALQVLPRLPLLSSHQFAWDGILVQYHQQPAWETHEHCHTQHVIGIRHLQGEQIANAEFVIVPATAPHKDFWQQETDFILFSVEPARIAQIAHESVDGDRIELKSYIGMCDPVIYQIGRLFQSELKSNGLGSRLYADSLTTALSVQLLRNYCTKEQLIREYTNGLSKYKLQQAIAYINDNLTEDLSLEAIASHLQISVYYFARLFKQSMGVTPHQYVIQQRVQRAKQLLKQQNKLSISEVAFQVGFAHQSHLSRHFKRILGVTPKEICKK